MKPGNIDSRFFTVRQMKIHCYVAGKASGETPVIFLHGGGIDSAWLSWGEVMGPVSGKFRVFAPDLPGYGKSDKPDITYSLDFYVDFLNELINQLGLKKAHLVGLSLGGGLAIRYSLMHPDKVDRLVLVAPYGIFSKLVSHKLSYFYVKTFLNELSYRLLRSRKFTRWSLLSGVIYDARKLTDELFEEIYQAGLEPFAGKAFMSFQRSELTPAGIRSDLTGQLSQIQAPTLIIQGKEDPAVRPVYARKAHEKIPRSRLCLFEKCRHWPQREHPEKFIQAVIEFLTNP
ncbi:alpha/beta fold hydrolase [Thermoactinomyces mirandus]|uniref:Alpha/beta hydrolase n=1 Tax=Thermoactinomyces mirandus TaxID=2756294 RepID=A0A7W1XU98_9BACL|nr:alpha/beta hydrolase [Thermoactinomyces mirandus]MBA4603419.1 alpha/beta hydrolase [Thermoactinomyces mirandus]